MWLDHCPLAIVEPEQAVLIEHMVRTIRRHGHELERLQSAGKGVQWKVRDPGEP
jgi:hypothetical protein